MEDNNNKISEESDKLEEYQFNFINIPWDDRTKSSKVGIISLLLAICLVIAACVINTFILHYQSFYKNGPNNHEIKCHLVNMESNMFVARIHLISTQQLLCLGAVVGPSSVIANGVCIKSGPIRLGLGNPTNHLCKKGFTVNLIDPIRHDGAVSNTIVLLSTTEKISSCSSVIKIGKKLDFETKLYVIGRPLLLDRVPKTVSQQSAMLLRSEETNNISQSMKKAMKYMKKTSMICVKDLSNCPVRVGDLLIQNNEVFGLASTSVYRTDRSNMACFADLNTIRRELMELIDDDFYKI